VNTNPSIESLSKDILNLKNLIIGLASQLQEQDNTLLGGWISEEKAITITGLSKSSLYRLRKSGKVRSSFIVGKGMFYMLSDFKRLLDTNHRLT